MLPLPDLLHAWRPWLDWFAPELADAVGRMVQSLDPLLGPWRGDRLAGAPEPDGFDDVRRRGPYERLVPSEWLLADALPDEFLRRAAAGEHLFFAPRPQARRVARTIVALFDAGPLQLGAPRLAHIALWILLVRRAAAAKGVLRWGVLQLPGQLNDGIQPADLKRLLRLRSFAVAAPWTAWDECLAAATAGSGELWRIGGTWDTDDFGSAVRPSHSVSLQRAVARDALDIAIIEDRRRRTAVLDLPPAPLAARLLRGNFLEPAPAPAHARSHHKFAMSRPPILSFGGGHVAVQLLGQRGIQVFRVPKPGRNEGNSRLHQLPRGTAEPLALAFHGKALGALLSGQDHLHFWQIDLPPLPRPSRDSFQGTPGRANWLDAVLCKGARGVRLYVLDEARRLVAFEPDGEGATACRLREVASDVLGLARAGGARIVYAQQEGGKLVVHVVGDQRYSPRFLLRAVPVGASAAYFAGGEGWARGFCTCAVVVREHVEAPSLWHLYYPPPDGVAFDIMETIALPAGHVGVGLVPSAAGGPSGVIGVPPDGRRVVLYHGADHRSTIYTCANKIQRISVDGASGLIALVTAARELIVYSTRDKTLRLYVHGDGSDDDPA
jgi:hypothetical protein